MRSGFAAILILFLGVTIARAGETQAPQACKLLTLQDVSKVVGSGFQHTSTEVYDPGPSGCGYNKGSADSVGFFIGEPDPGPYLKDQQARFKKGGLAVTPVAGLGEGAFYVISNNRPSSTSLSVSGSPSSGSRRAGSRTSMPR